MNTDEPSSALRPEFAGQGRRVSAHAMSIVVLRPRLLPPEGRRRSQSLDGHLTRPWRG
jgi:hypothetical protein